MTSHSVKNCCNEKNGKFDTCLSRSLKPIELISNKHFSPYRHGGVTILRSFPIHKDDINPALLVDNIKDIKCLEPGRME